jgi:xylulokinase
VTTAAYRPNPESRLHAYAHTLPDRWFQMAAMLNGARPMAWFADLARRPLPELLAEAETAPPGPLFLPYLSGERTPHGDAAIRAGFARLDEATTQGSLMRAVVEAIAFTFVDAFDAMAGAGTRPERVAAIGGGTRSAFLMQMIADATGQEIHLPEGADLGPAFGAARLARAAAGAEPAPVYGKPASARRFTPRPGAQAALAGRLQAFRALYHALRQIEPAP